MAKLFILTGCGTAMVTPFKKNGDLDEDALRKLVEWQITSGINFLVPCGSTGEAATMTMEEHLRVVAITAEVADHRVPIVAGAGSNDTAKAIALSKALKNSGATHLLHVTPMYNKPPQRGMLAHFRAVADAGHMHVILYNVPGRTGINLTAETTLKLAEHEMISGIKEASGNLDQMAEIIRWRPFGFSVLSGDDALTLPVIALGGNGVVSVVSNVVPKEMTELTTAALAGDRFNATALNEQLMRWMRAAFIESNPIPAKAALHMMGRIGPTLRLPLVELAPEHQKTVRDAIVEAGAKLT
jgi:4-hydroxy-tetrahydrodipicolinate synthase